MNINKQQRLQEAKMAHCASIEQSLQHRLEVARTKGDATLIRQLEAEMEYYKL